LILLEKSPVLIYVPANGIYCNHRSLPTMMTNFSAGN
jgi:hypothetical protein